MRFQGLLFTFTSTYLIIDTYSLSIKYYKGKIQRKLVFVYNCLLQIRRRRFLSAHKFARKENYEAFFDLQESTKQEDEASKKISVTVFLSWPRTPPLTRSLFGALFRSNLRARYALDEFALDTGAFLLRGVREESRDLIVLGDVFVVVVVGVVDQLLPSDSARSKLRFDPRARQILTDND